MKLNLEYCSTIVSWKNRGTDFSINETDRPCDGILAIKTKDKEFHQADHEMEFPKNMKNIRFLLTLTTIIDILKVGKKNKEKIPHNLLLKNRTDSTKTYDRRTGQTNERIKEKDRSRTNMLLLVDHKMTLLGETKPKN